MPERTQTVVFMRHGIAEHNFPGADLKSPTLLDPPLVTRGKFGAIEAGKKIQMWFMTRGKRIDLVVSSPLTRCLQTASLAFLPGDDYPSSSDNERQSRSIPIACTELPREAHGVHYPDKRRSKDLLEKYWPSVRFDSKMSNPDELWHEAERESIQGIADRATEFLKKLCTLSENALVVVSHGVFLEILFQTHDPNVLAEGRRVYNCDAFACECVSSENGTFLRLQNTYLI